MKPITMIRSLVLLAVLAAGAVSCQKEEHPATGGDAPQGTPLTIYVVDGGYMASDKSSVAQTRATENGYTTEFTAGDKIGLYVVKPDGSYAHQNIALTLTDNGSGTLAWTPPTGTTLYNEGAAAKYFAYYPYSSLLEDQTPPTAAGTTPTSFFAGLITAWNPAPDQSTYASYTDQDLMVGSGTVSKQGSAFTLDLTLTHAMALVVIETPMTKYTFTNNNPAIPDYDLPAPDTRFYGFAPYSPSVGTYRLLVKPSQNGANDLMGSYAAASGNTKEYAIVQNSISAANYVHSKVDNATVTTKTHTLQAGDFYLKDGSLVGKDETLSDAQKAACVGVVYWVGDPTNTTNGDPLLKTKHSSCTHGLVVALQDAGGKSLWSSSYEDITNNWLNNQSSTYDITSLKEQNKMQGYANTQALIGYNTTSSNVQNNSNLKVLPIEAITTYASAHPTPASSSGWYFPSVKELKYMCWGQGATSQSAAGRDFLNAQFEKVSGTSLQSSYYWSSTEGDNRWAWSVSFYNGYVGYNYKDSGSCGVRAVLAF